MSDAERPILVRGNRWDLLPTRATSSTTVSVIIPHYEQRDQLHRVLQALSLQTFPAAGLEIVVADDGTPAGPRCPTELPSGATVRIVRQEDRGFRAAAARNLGAAVSSGSLLVFLDADTVPEPAFVSELLRLPRVSPDVLTVGRRRHTDLTGWTPAAVRAWLLGTGPAPPVLPEPSWLADAYAHSDGLLTSDDRSFRFVLSSVLGCSRELFEDLGGFDERYEEYGGEDWDLGYRAYNNGAVLAHAPQAVAWHDGPSWEGRDHPADAKTFETLRLAALIPEPSTRGPARPGMLPDILVEVDDGPWSATALAACAHCLLDQTCADLAVRLPPSTDERLLESLSGTGRVGREPWSDDQFRRARVRIRLHEPVVLRSGTIAHLRAAVAAPEGGRVRGVTGGRHMISAESTRLLGRARRWAARGWTHDQVAAEAFDDSTEDVTALVERTPIDGLELANLLARRATRV